jgi:hypothetical protein
VRDYDTKLRCLCGNFLAPTNGQCHAKLKGLRHQCRRTDDCEDYMTCRVNNSTKTTILSSISKDNSKKEMLCLCDEESGYMENIYDKHCNGERRNGEFLYREVLTRKTFLQPLSGISSPACSATLRQWFSTLPSHRKSCDTRVAAATWAKINFPFAVKKT